MPAIPGGPRIGVARVVDNRQSPIDNPSMVETKIPPMLAKLTPEIPQDAGWLFEPKGVGRAD
jgi:hypothetical protein